MEIGDYAYLVGRASRRDLENEMKRRLLIARAEKLHDTNPEALQRIMTPQHIPERPANIVTPGAMIGGRPTVGGGAAAPRSAPSSSGGSGGFAGSFQYGAPSAPWNDTYSRGGVASPGAMGLDLSGLNSGPRTPEQVAIAEKRIADAEENNAALRSIQQKWMNDAYGGGMGGGMPAADPKQIANIKMQIAGWENALKGSPGNPTATTAINRLNGQLQALTGGASAGMGGGGIPPARPSELSREVTLPGSDQPYLTNRTENEMASMLARRFGGSPQDILQHGQDELAWGQGTPPQTTPEVASWDSPGVKPTTLPNGEIIMGESPDRITATLPIPPRVVNAGNSNSGIRETNLPAPPTTEPHAQGQGGAPVIPVSATISKFDLTPEEVAALAKAETEGRLDPLKLNSRTAKIMAQLELKNPGTQHNTLSAQATYQRSATPMNTMTLLNSIDPLFNNILVEGKKLKNTDFPFINKPVNWIKEKGGSAEIVSFNNLRDDVVAELERGLLGTGVLSDSKYNRALANVNSAQSYKQLEAAVNQMRTIVKARLEAIQTGPYSQGGETLPGNTPAATSGKKIGRFVVEVE